MGTVACRWGGGGVNRAILDHMLADGCSTMADACHWLNANYSKILETCGISVYQGLAR